jgi:hypothetical protein
VRVSERQEGEEEGWPEEPLCQIPSRGKFINGEHLRIGCIGGRWGRPLRHVERAEMDDALEARRGVQKRVVHEQGGR